MSTLIPMNILMKMTGMSIAMNMLIPTNMNTPIRIHTMKLLAIMSIRMDLARTIIFIRIIALKRISTNTDDDRTVAEADLRKRVICHEFHSGMALFSG